MAADASEHIVPVILAGGVGSRLWPLSRTYFPKQFHRLLGEPYPSWAPMLSTANASRRSKTYEPLAIERSSLSSLRLPCYVSFTQCPLSLVPKESAASLPTQQPLAAPGGQRLTGAPLLPGARCLGLAMSASA